ncbi:winged helix-turn-helix domain-containing protein [Natronorarus salvus]|uniref:winged helix-turn-helix domain-containing protein n=1 Tax=Natronorarus salvus TaxID=3117733 RepID=UPI002F26D8EE
MTDDTDSDDGDEIPVEIVEPGSDDRPRDRFGGTGRAVEGFDEGIIDLLSWILDTETRARIYVYLRQEPRATSEEVAEGTGLYPSTVREALSELHEEEVVDREKRESEGAGNNPYEYTAIAPSELVGGILGQVQDELNTAFNLDRYLDQREPTGGSEPITISVEDDADEEDAERDDEGEDLDDGE